MRRLRIAALGVACALAPAPALAQAVTVDAGIPAYEKTSAVSGSLSSIGSDTLNNVMTLWAEGFQKTYPNVRVQVEGKGSSTAPPALIAGTAQIGPMSRAMKQTELDDFEKKFGYKPTQIRVAIDGLAIYVHRDNPVKELALPQVDAIFSKNRRCGGEKDITTWGELGVTGAYAARPISLFGRNSASGTYGYFKEHALCNGDYKDTVKEQPGSAAVVNGVTEDRYAIGYSGLGYRTSSVRALAISPKAGEPAVSDDPSNIYAGKYPLSRFLYVYVNRAPGKPLDPLVREFLRYVLSNEGQQVVVKDGYLPLKAATDAEERAKLD